MQQLTPAVAAALRETMALASRGNLNGARAFAEKALRENGSQGPIHALLGMICCRAGDLSSGIEHMREALRSNPNDPVIAANLTTAMIDSGRFGEAVEICTQQRAMNDPSGRMWRLRGFILQQTDDHAAAASAYEQVVAIAPDDFESWNNLGNARVTAGEMDAGIAALERASALAPANGPVHLNLAAAYSNAGNLTAAADILSRYTAKVPDDATALVEQATVLRHLYRDSEALEVLEKAVAASPGNIDLLVQMGEEQGAAWRFADAEKTLRRALNMDRRHGRAFVQLAILLEHLNREDELPVLLSEAQSAGADQGTAHFLQALICRREKRFEEGLRFLAEVPRDIEPIRLAQLEGQFRDRLNDADGAFAAFTEMNELFKQDPSEPLVRAARYRSALQADRDVVTPEWFAGWRDLPPGAGEGSPVFLIGFPRSGTTLLDTMLMGHDNVQVLEERPTLQKVEERLGGIARLADLSGEEVDDLRKLYFHEVSNHIERRPGALLVDKSPLHMTKAPLIQRLFPDAKFILALRHPCDVVLSCFITSFRLNNAMSNFLDLGTAAEFYNACFGYWEHCRSIIPIQVHPIFYEQMVNDSEAELRPLFDYLGLDWREGVLDHQRTAAARGLISTASYAQVTEPIYRRAAGRWTRYRDHLNPVLPVLQPWVERFGYSI
ncbi:tetratricopeptide repeat-containing sulfotransferase family protein [Sphingobium phenoxybenzoativorans]|uniref:tetratricopeptide repeat-containing sulfotransferase family protein n=1 Tax=Sphingobium phenoxybenzoativorans TaxID=1592790 RepID=UPI0008730987|nr:tetratricopeptide repeat-containing sulfotransferase family protein [Sphingobium phenoxybenzoativorans]